MINRIISQMNNNRLSSSSSLQVDRDLLLCDLKVMLEGGSNYEFKSNGQIVIKSTGKFLKKGAPIGVLVLDENGDILNEFESINTCGAYLGVSHHTIRSRLHDGKSIKFHSKLVYVKPK